MLKYVCNPLAYIGDVTFGQYLFSEKLLTQNSPLQFLFILLKSYNSELNFSFDISCNTPITNSGSLSFNQITND